MDWTLFWIDEHGRESSFPYQTEAAFNSGCADKVRQMRNSGFRATRSDGRRYDEAEIRRIAAAQA